MNIKLKEELGNRVAAIVDGTLSLITKLGAVVGFGMFSGAKPTPLMQEVAKITRNPPTSCRGVDERIDPLQHKPTLGLKK